MQTGLVALCAAAGVVFCCAGTTLAQDALGDGRVLDNSLRVGQRYNPPRRDYRDELRFRNAIVTGNAPGGFSFRGDVGYTSPLEFRGTLGSDDTFAFRRDSLYSGLAGAGIRGTDALQYQFALTSGARMPQGLAGRLAYTRDGSSYTREPRGYRGVPGTDGRLPPGSSVPTPGGDQSTLARTPRVDEPTSQTSMLRSTGAYTATRAYQPYLVAAIQTDTGPQDFMGLTANPLRGLRVADFVEPTDEEKDPPTGRISTAYEDVVARVRERASALYDPDEAAPGEPERPPQTETEVWARRLAELRKRLRGETDEDTGEAPGTLPGTEPGEQPGAQPGDQPGREPDTDADGDDADRARTFRFDPKTMQLLRDDGGRIDRLVGEGADADSLYVRHMRAGESALSRGRYFEAEDRFTLALSVRRGDVAAQAGRVNAQLGAGLFLSAGLNLRELLTRAPELAGSRYAGELLPAPERLEALMGLLRENLGLADSGVRPRAAGRRLERESGLMLAYVGHQTSDRETVEQGLRGWAKSIEASEADGNDERIDRALHLFLSELWTPGEGGG